MIDLSFRDGVSVKELTVADIRQFVISREQRADTDTIKPEDLLTFDKGLLLSDLVTLTDLEEGDLDQLTEGDITLIVDESERLNPLFFERMLAPMGSEYRARIKGT